MVHTIIIIIIIIIMFIAQKYKESSYAERRTDTEAQRLNSEVPALTTLALDKHAHTLSHTHTHALTYLHTHAYTQTSQNNVSQ